LLHKTEINIRFSTSLFVTSTFFQATMLNYFTAPNWFDVDKLKINVRILVILLGISVAF